jgi:transposase InsO family protein
VHGLSQAIQKRGLPRALLTDNGPAMVAEEVTEGLLRLGIVQERTLPYSPYQKGYTSSCTSFVSSLETLGNRRGSVNLIPCRLSGPFALTGSYRYSGLLW